MAISPANLARFQREAQLTCELSGCRHLARGLEWGECHGNHYIVLELVNGRTLEQVFVEDGRQDWRLAGRVVLQIAKALAHLGAHGIVHRDVKPSNIMVDDAGHAVLIDLGASPMWQHPRLRATHQNGQGWPGTGQGGVPGRERRVPGRAKASQDG